MSHLFVLLVLLLTTCLSGLFSPVSAQFSMRRAYGTNVTRLEPVPPGGILEVSLYTHFPAILFCIREGEESCNPGSISDPSLPTDTQLKSTNPDVASVEGTGNPSI